MLLVILCPIAGAAGQASGTLALGTGTVRYGGGTSTSLGTLSPSLLWVSPALSAFVSGTAALLPQSVWAYEGNTSVTYTSGPIAERWRINGELSATATSVSGGDRTGALTLVGEIARRGAGWGVAVGGGPAAGWITGVAGAAGPQVRLRLWQDWTSVRLTGRIESTRILGAWYSDFTAGAGLHAGPVDLTVSAVARASRGWGSAAGGSVAANVFLLPQVGLEIAGGSALADPLQGFPRTGFVTAGVRVYLPPRPRPSSMSRALAHAGRDGLVQVTFQISGDSVSIAGDWNGWSPEPLEHVGAGEWRLTRRLAPGAYRFGLVIGSDKHWVVPAGFATVPDDWGGRAAVLVVQ